MTTNTEATPEVTDAPLTGAADEAVELNLDGLEFDLDIDAAQAVEEPAPEPAPAPPMAAVPPAPAPIVLAPEPKIGPPKRGDLTKALKESREKERYYKNLARDLSATRPRHTSPPLTFRTPTISDKEIAEIRQQAEKATDLGAPAELVLRTVDQRIQQAFQSLGPTLEAMLRQRETARMEAAFVRRHPDYYTTLQKAGIPQMLSFDPATGAPLPGFNRRLADELFTTDNPVEAAYQIAKAMLGETTDDETEPVAPSPPAAPVAAVPQSVPVPASAEVVEAERRGARQVAERVASNLTKPRGVRALSSAGEPPKVVLNEEFRKYLDTEYDRNPEKIRQFFGKNPDVKDWWLEQGRWASTRR